MAQIVQAKAKVTFRKLYALYERHKRPGVTLDEYYRKGSFTLNLPSNLCADLPRYSLEALTDLQNNDARLTNGLKESLLPIRTQEREDIQQSCLGCLVKEQKIQDLRDTLCWSNGSNYSEKLETMEPGEYGPKDSEIRRSMEKIRNSVCNLVDLLQNLGFGSGPFPPLNSVERLCPKLCILLKHIYRIKDSQSLFEEIENRGIDSPKRVNLILALVGAALVHWVFDTNSTEIQNENSAEIQRYKSLVQEKGQSSNQRLVESTLFPSKFPKVLQSD